MTAATLPFDDWLALSHDPKRLDQSNLYFIGTFDRRITFYSQQVRALRFADALSRSGMLLPTHNVAVVGGGAAGLTAALAVALLGNDVTLYDPANKVLHLQSASSRLLHPHIYEWPRLGSLENQAGLPILDWVADSGESVSKRLQESFEAAKARLPRLKFDRSRQLKSLERVGNEWKLGLQAGNSVEPKIFQHVVLAMGFGEERSCGASVPTDYWKPTGIGTSAIEPKSGTTYLVSGNGDGGLTELLSLLISDFDHVGFTRRFLDMFSGDALREACGHVFDGVALGTDLEPALRNHLLPILKERDILDRLTGVLRTDRLVTFNSGGPHFEASKAAQLNQCMVFAVLESAELAGIKVRRSTGIITDVVAVSGSMRVAEIRSDGHEIDTGFMHVILRHGPDRDARYHAAGAYYADYRTYMKDLVTARPELIDPPLLDPDIYERFEALSVAQLIDEVNRPGLIAHIEQRRATIVLGIDRAAGILTQKGKWTLSQVADKCERLSEIITIQLGINPTQLPLANDLVRLSRASDGLILLKADASVYPAWLEIGSIVSQSQEVPCFYSPSKLELSDLSSSIDACLIRLLDARVTRALQSGECESLGPINIELLAEIEKTWLRWRTVLDTEKSVCKSFLRWLANVDPTDSNSWDGDHARLDDLASALVLTLATHLGEPMTPASLLRGNLLFSSDALALGSGCKTIGGRLIADWTKPEQWGVDALIVSTTSEIMITSSPAGTLIDGGQRGRGLLRARQVAPAVVQNSHFWRRGLSGTLAIWKGEVAKEFAEFRKRQDASIDEVSE
jgi:FAD dependent oxidoreductase